MKAKGPREERETVITLNEAEDTTHLWTASEVVYRRLLKRLGTGYLTEDGERHAVFVFPSKFLDLPRVKAKRELDPERRALLAQRMAERRKLLGARE